MRGSILRTVLTATAAVSMIVAISSCASDPPARQTAVAVTSPDPVTVPASISIGSSVWTNVSVATLWTSPTAARMIDAPALRAPVDIPRWVAGMSVASRRDLVGRVETQTLLGERLVVTGERKIAKVRWLHVVAVNQTTHRDPRGYPGWLPARQVTSTAPATSARVATVIRPTAWLRDRVGKRALRVSIATRLPTISVTATTVSVMTPRHLVRTIAADAVVVRRPQAAALTPSASGVVSTARTLLGLPYLWGGRSGFAVDCSGLTQLVFKLRGVNLPRDAGDQATYGRSVRIGSARAGDLIFFDRPIAHVGIVAAPGRMLHSPQTGSIVKAAPISSVGPPVATRRFL